MSISLSMCFICASKKRIAHLCTSVLIALSISTSSAYAADLSSLIKAGESKHKLAQQSQDKVDRLTEDRRKLYNEFKAVNKEIEDLRTYNKQLAKQITTQEKDLTRIQKTIEQVTVTQRRIPPFILEMIKGLEDFIALDVPFLLKERQERLVFIKELLDRSDVTVAEKFRRVIETYQNENDYGTTIDTYKGTEEIQGVEREVEYLRVGRVAWVYQTLDGQHNGVWNQQAKAWEDAGGYKREIAQGIKMAKKQAAPDLITLPINAPKKENAQ